MKSVIVGSMFAAALLVPMAAIGNTLYEKNCAGCHGVDGKGNPMIAKVMLGGDISLLDLTKSNTAKKSDADLKAVILNGAGKMKGSKDKLTGKDAGELVKYIRSLHK